MNIDRWQSVPSQQLENSVIITNKGVDMWFGSIISDSRRDCAIVKRNFHYSYIASNIKLSIPDSQPIEGT